MEAGEPPSGDDPKSKRPPGMPDPEQVEEFVVPEGITDEQRAKLSQNIADTILTQIADAQIPHLVDYCELLVIARARGGTDEHIAGFFPELNDRGRRALSTGKITIDGYGHYHIKH